MFQGGAPVSPIPKATSFVSGALATDPTGRYLFALNPTNSSVSVYAIGAAAVSLTVEPGSAPTGTNPVSLTTDGIGNFLYVANQGSSSISVYGIDYSNSAALTAINGSPLSLSSPPVFLCGEPTGQFLFVADMSGAITTYKIDVKSGVLTSASSISVGSVNSMSTNASGYLYAAAQNLGLFVYMIDQSSGALTAVPGSPFPATDARAIVTKSTLQ
jgi:6-phosphogluconolactonase (cycloisomerase 2 family)